MSTLIVGSTGYVGKALVSKMSSLGSRPATLDRDGNNKGGLVLRHEATENKVGLDQIGKHLSRLGITTVVNLYASTRKSHDFESADDLVESNVRFPTLIASSMDSADIHFIQMGTYSYKGAETVYHPQTLYSATKFTAERLLEFYAHRLENFRVTNLHCYDIYGPHHHKSRLVPFIIDGLRHNRQVNLSEGQQKIAPIHINDVVGALGQVISTPQSADMQSYDLFGPEVYSVQELATRVANLLGSNPNLLVFDQPYRWREVMEFKPCHPLPPGFSSRVGLEEGTQSLIDALHG